MEISKTSVAAATFEKHSLNGGVAVAFTKFRKSLHELNEIYISITFKVNLIFFFSYYYKELK